VLKNPQGKNRVMIGINSFNKNSSKANHHNEYTVTQVTQGKFSQETHAAQAESSNLGKSPNTVTTTNDKASQDVHPLTNGFSPEGQTTDTQVPTPIIKSTRTRGQPITLAAIQRINKRAVQHSNPDKLNGVTVEDKEQLCLATMAIGNESATSRVKTLIDTGAEASVICRRLFQRLPNQSEVKYTINEIHGGLKVATCAGNQTIEAFSVEGLNYFDDNGNQYKLSNVIVCDLDHATYQCIIGWPDIQKAEGVIDAKERTVLFRKHNTTVTHEDRDGAKTARKLKQKAGLLLLESAITSTEVEQWMTNEVPMQWFTISPEGPHKRPQRINASEFEHTDGDKPMKQQQWFINQDQDVQSLLAEYEDIFADKVKLPAYVQGDKKDREANIITQGDLTSIIGKARIPHVSPDQAKELSLQIQWLLDKNFITRSESPVASPVHLVRKKSAQGEWNQWRMIADFRALNSATQADAGSLPRLDTIIDRLSGQDWYSSLDCSAWYQQTPIRYQDRWKTAFHDQFGNLYHFNCLSFGLVNAGAQAGRSLAITLQDIDNASAYADDCIAHTEGDKERHLQVLRNIFQRFRRDKLYINPQKSVFLTKEFSFFGFKFNAEGRSIDHRQRDAVLDMPLPHSSKALHRLLGVYNYFAPFIDGFADIATPLYDLLSAQQRPQRDRQRLTKDGQPRSCPLVLHKQHIQAIQKIRKALASDPVLRHPDFKKRFYLITDASKQASSAALCQKYICDGQERLLPIFYFSKKFKKSHAACAPYHVELISVIRALKRYRPYMIHRTEGVEKPVLLTDHKPLCAFPFKKKLTAWESGALDYLAEFDMKYEYYPGSAQEQHLPDYLTRPFDAKKGILYQACRKLDEDNLQETL